MPQKKPKANKDIGVIREMLFVFPRPSPINITEKFTRLFLDYYNIYDTIYL